MMKIAVSASGVDINAQIDPRFGRCEYLLIIDTENMNTVPFPNDYKDMSGGAGTQSAAFVISKGARAVLTGNCGPKAMDVFNSENIPVYTGQTGTVAQAVEQFKKSGCQTATASPNVPQGGAAGRQRQGTGGSCMGGGGRGMGGGGRGMGGGGRGMGRGCGMPGRS
jgi:predicted Fe-Mo cluster-binding NifX family protein